MKWVGTTQKRWHTTIGNLSILCNANTKVENVKLKI